RVVAAPPAARRAAAVDPLGGRRQRPRSVQRAHRRGIARGFHGRTVQRLLRRDEEGGAALIETITQALARQARERPAALALLDDRVRLGWGEVAAWVARAAGWFRG